MPDPAEIYYCFADDDIELVEQLEVHLDVLRLEETIKEGWSRRKVIAGKETQAEIDEHLERAKIILLMISAYFISSDYLGHQELKRALEKHARGEVRVIPIRLRSCLIPRNSPLNKLEMVPPAGKPPVAEAPIRHRAFTDIADHIRRTVDELQGKRPIKQTKKSRKLPEAPTSNFIASLCDRSKQKERLKEALGKQKTLIAEQNSLVPLLCFVHGKFDESLEGFKQRLRENDIYELLELDRNQCSVEFVTQKWPRLEPELSNPQAHFEKVLESKVLNHRPPASMQDVLNHLGRHPGPVLLCYDVFSENWNADSPSLIEAFQSFWGNIPKISSTTPLIVCLFFEYELADTANPNLPVQRNAEARTYFHEREQELVTSNYCITPNLCGVVLQELGPVSRTEVNEWIDDSRAFAEFCIRHRPSFCHPEEIVQMKKAITKLYASLPAGNGIREIPMDQLMDSLGELLNKYRCRTQ